MPFQFAYDLAGPTGSVVPKAVSVPMSGSVYNDGDLLKLDTSTGYFGTVAAGDPGTTVAAVFNGTRTGGTAGQYGTVSIITRSQVWKCITNSTSMSVNMGAGSVQVVNAGTINATAGTNDSCRLWALGTASSGTIIAYVQFTSPVFG